MSDRAVDPLWSDLQVSWLQAMGHTVYLDRSLEPAPAVQAAVPARSEAGSTAARPQRSPPPRSSPEREDVVAAVRAAPPRRTRVGMPDRLQIALLRASGCNPAEPQTQQLMASWPLAELRGNPAAKRALWPQLRALRRKAAP